MTIRVEQRYHGGKLIVEETTTLVTNSDGIRVRRTERLLEDGTVHVVDSPELSSSSSAPPMMEPSAPYESSDTRVPPESSIPMTAATGMHSSSDIPFAEAMCVPSEESVPATTRPVAVVTGSPQPPSVAVITGQPRPPPQVVYPSNSYAYRDERSGACIICGISAIVCVALCLCCMIPALVVPIAWVLSGQKESLFDDDFWNDDHNRP